MLQILQVNKSGPYRTLQAQPKPVILQKDGFFDTVRNDRLSLAQRIDEIPVPLPMAYDIDETGNGHTDLAKVAQTNTL